VIKEKKLIARKERLRAEELREKYTFPKITRAAGDLLTKMNQHKHFYLALANPAYKNVIGHLEKIRLLSQKAISQNAEDPFTDEDAKKLVRAIDLGAKEAKKYLSDKQAEMERDPRRKNDPGEMKNEQPRIDAVLDCYEVLSEMALSLRARENTKDIITLDEERNATVNQFSDELTSNLSDPRGAQKDSGENRLYIPAHKAADLERLESHFGFVASKKKKLRIVSKDNDMISDNGVYPAIGGVDEADHLSKKDFAALAIAASTTPEAMKDEYKVADSSGSFTAEDNLAYHRGDLLHRVVRAKQEDLESIRPDIQKSKGIVSKALLDYKQGNIDPLGKLIADGIKNLNDLYAGGRYAGDKETELYMAEMGLRMKGMLERDQRLMEKAMTYGVTPKMLKDLKNQGIAAQNGVLAARWSSEEYLAKGENWGIREKERNYVDLLVNRYLEEEREKAVPKAKAAAESKEAQYSRQLKTPKSTPYMDKISDVGNERELRDRFRAYIRKNGYMDYTPKEFLDEIVGSKEKPAVGRNASLMVELGAFEASQKAKKSAPLEVSRNLVFSEKTRKAAAPGKTKQGATVKKVQKPVLG
jgi:hypothetical protein